MKKIPLHIKIKAFFTCLLWTIPLFISTIQDAEEEAEKEKYERGEI